MLTDVQIINLGLGKIAANQITRIDPPATPLEKYIAPKYEQWKRSELSKRRWVFATVDDYLLTLNATTVGVERPYSFALPIDCLKITRNNRSEWVQRGRFLNSHYSSLRIQYIRNADESEFDPLFNDVLAARIAVECAEYVTQSTTKKQTAMAEYDDAVSEAGKQNAYVIGPEPVADDPASFTWEMGLLSG